MKSKYSPRHLTLTPYPRRLGDICFNKCVWINSGDFDFSNDSSPQTFYTLSVYPMNVATNPFPLWGTVPVTPAPIETLKQWYTYGSLTGAKITYYISLAKSGYINDSGGAGSIQLNEPVQTFLYFCNGADQYVPTMNGEEFVNWPWGKRRIINVSTSDTKKWKISHYVRQKQLTTFGPRFQGNNWSVRTLSTGIWNEPNTTQPIVSLMCFRPTLGSTIGTLSSPVRFTCHVQCKIKMYSVWWGRYAKQLIHDPSGALNATHNPSDASLPSSGNGSAAPTWTETPPPTP